jgi:membrane protease subunit HflC
MIVLAVAILAVVVLVGSAFFAVRESQQALVLQFGEPRELIRDSGLHTKIPFVQNVVFMDKRILDLDTEPMEVIAADQKRLIVDAFARFRIIDPLRFYQTVGNEMVARSRLATILNSSVRQVLGSQSFFAVLSGERAELMRQIRDRVNNEASGLGIEVLDVRIRRADLPQANSQAIYRRMQTEREREAREARAQGAEIAQRIRSRADREVTVLLAEARRDSEVTRGDGDAERNRIFAEAYEQDEAFFDFYRSMQAYRQALDSGDTTLVLSPDGTFFRHFGTLESAAGGLETASEEGGEQPAESGVPAADLAAEAEALRGLDRPAATE